MLGQDRNPGPGQNALLFSIDPKGSFSCPSHKQPHATHHSSILTMPPGGPGPGDPNCSIEDLKSMTELELIPKISENDRVLCDESISEYEFWLCIKELENNEIPGCDALISEF